MATIQTRRNSRGVATYRVGYYDHGKFKYTPTMANHAGAERIKTIIETQGPAVALQILDAQQADQGLTLAAWFERHLKIKSISATEGTIAGYRAEAQRTWLPRLGDMPLASITRDHVIDWITWQIDQPTARSQARRERAKAAGVTPLPPLEKVSAKTVQNAHGLLSSVLETAARDEHIPRNVAKGAPLPKDGTREEKEIFSRDEWDRFYAAMQDHYKPLTAYLLVTGCRIGEATAVRVRDINPAALTVSVLRAWKKGASGKVEGAPKSRRSRRVVKVPAWAMETFKAAAQGKDPDDLLFTTPTGRRISDINYNQRQWKAALTRAGIDKHLTPHSARHTFASWALMAGVSPQTVQHRLGHESLQTTSEVYGHLLLEAQDEAVSAIGWEPAGELTA